MADEIKPVVMSIEVPRLTQGDPNKLKVKLETVTSAMCGTIYDYLIYRVQDNSASQAYKQQVRAFFKDTTRAFIDSLNNPHE